MSDSYLFQTEPVSMKSCRISFLQKYESCKLPASRFEIGSRQLIQTLCHVTVTCNPQPSENLKSRTKLGDL